MVHLLYEEDDFRFFVDLENPTQFEAEKTPIS
jgi:translation elongation factor P/translation initiation factor 5A